VRAKHGTVFPPSQKTIKAIGAKVEYLLCSRDAGRGWDLEIHSGVTKMRVSEGFSDTAKGKPQPLPRHLDAEEAARVARIPRHNADAKGFA
jgi:hypothetical protein